ncbi:MAG: Lrp/AsnC family transcriptional regulator [Candidatus Lokiarchaeota archaeon]|jgi:Lrp/AsnC family transcriptional regulator
MIDQESKIDKIDHLILHIIQSDPLITHTEIAKRVNRSQPTIGMRIRKLIAMGVLDFQAGLNVRIADVYMAQCELYTTDIDKMLQIVDDCPFMINAFKVSGDTNLIILIVGFTLQDIDRVVNYHFRNNPNITKITMRLVMDVLMDYVINIDFQKLLSDDFCCKSCLNHEFITED